MKVLITGATGLIGSRLVSFCLREHIQVHYLTTSKNKIEDKPGKKGFYWNPEKDEINPLALEGVSVIIHLAGASISQRWTRANKKEILESRTQTCNLLFNTLKATPNKVARFISASGIGIYPPSKTKLYTEEDVLVDSSFTGEVVVAWEAAADQFKTLGMDVTKVRTGLVLSSKGGAFPKLVKPIKSGVGAPLGSGKQWLSWIHIDDVAGIYMAILKKEWEGIYNAVAPTPVTNKKLTRQIAAQLQIPLLIPRIPSFLIKLVLGEMAMLVLKGQLVSSNKVEAQGYKFEYQNIEKAVQELLNE